MGRSSEEKRCQQAGLVNLNIPHLKILRWGILISRYINIAHPGYNTIFLSCMPLSRIQNSPNSIFDLVFHFWDQLNTLKTLTNSAQFSVIIMNSTKYIFKALLLLMKKIQCTSADSRHQPGCCCWRTRGSLGGLFSNVCFAVIQKWLGHRAATSIKLKV